MAKRKVSPKVKFNKLQIGIMAGLTAVAGLFVYSALAGSSPSCVVGQVAYIFTSGGGSSKVSTSNTSSGAKCSSGSSSGGTSSSSSSSTSGTSSNSSRTRRFDGELSCKASAGKIRWTAEWENATTVVDLYQNGQRVYRFRKAAGPKTGSGSYSQTTSSPDQRIRSELRHGSSRVETESCRSK